MISTRDMKVLYEAPLHERHGGGLVQILGGGGISDLTYYNRYFIKRSMARNKVVNVVDRYEQVMQDGRIEVLPLNISAVQEIVHRLSSTQKSWAACFVLGDKYVDPLDWVKSESEHKYTSTGIKWWRHQQAMESYRDGTGRSVISTHISPEGKCNLRCGYCSVTYRDTHSSIPLPRIQKYVEDLQSRGLKAVILTGGGEPTLYPDFEKLVQWLKWERDLSVALITNGTTADRVRDAMTWGAFSWVRVSINIFDGWKKRIHLPTDKLSPNCVVGASYVYSVEHEAVREEVPLSRVELFRQIGEVATRSGAKYVRVLPNCLLEQEQLIVEHGALQRDLAELGDSRFFQQYKIHGAPQASVCHQAYFRPYLSEEPFVGPDGKGDSEPGTVYPCDSVVLNESVAHFGKKWQLCKPEDVLAFMDGKVEQAFDPRSDCSGCVFTGNVEMLGRWKDAGEGEFSDVSLVHEEFV